MKLAILLLGLFVVAFATEEGQKEDQPEVVENKENEDQPTEEKDSENEDVSEDDLDIPEDPKYRGKYYPCNKKCGSGIFHAAGKCNYKTGRCECVYGFTGPNSYYRKKSYPPNLITADHCTQPCHYTHDYRNPKCAYKYHYHGYGYKQHYKYNKHGRVTYRPKNKKYSHGYGYDEYNCHWKCGFGKFHAAGKCIGRNRCLCWWGWTGKGAVYVRKGYLKGRVIAHYCTKACHYTHDYKNPYCAYYHGNRQYPKHHHHR